jgi:hypothetical protein
VTSRAYLNLESKLQIPLMFVDYNPDTQTISVCPRDDLSREVIREVIASCLEFAKQAHNMPPDEIVAAMQDTTFTFKGIEFRKGDTVSEFSAGELN